MFAEIRGGDGVHYAALRLKPLEHILANHHAIISCSTKIEEKPSLVSRLLGALHVSGPTLLNFVPTQISSTSQGTQTLMLASQYPSSLRIIELKNETVIINSNAWLACSSGLKISIFWNGFIKSSMTRSSYRVKFSGTGTLILSSTGTFVEKKMDGYLQVNPNHLVTQSATTNLLASIFDPSKKIAKAQKKLIAKLLPGLIYGTGKILWGTQIPLLKLYTVNRKQKKDPP